MFGCFSQLWVSSKPCVHRKFLVSRFSVQNLCFVLWTDFTKIYKSLQKYTLILRKVNNIEKALHIVLVQRLVPRFLKSERKQTAEFRVFRNVLSVHFFVKSFTKIYKSGGQRYQKWWCDGFFLQKSISICMKQLASILQMIWTRTDRAVVSRLQHAKNSTFEVSKTLIRFNSQIFSKTIDF